MENHFELYKKCMKTGRLPFNGLCFSLFNDKFLNLMAPLGYEDYKDDGYWGYWGYDGDPLSSRFFQMRDDLRKRGISADEARFAFTPFRQTVLLFIAAMEGSL